MNQIALYRTVIKKILEEPEEDLPRIACGGTRECHGMEVIARDVGEKIAKELLADPSARAKYESILETQL